MKRGTCTCDRCGQDVGVEGVVTVELERCPNGRIDFIHVRECRECAVKAAREEKL